MVVNEIFYSLQGEGLLAGIPSIFIRLAGCPLRCTWCDTKYALAPAAGEDLTIPQILDKIKNLTSFPKYERRNTNDEQRFVVITGGEPMVNPQLPALAAALKKQKMHITIETAGIEFVGDIACDLMSISPKTSNSGQNNISIPALTRLIEHYHFQFKFVVDKSTDIAEIRQVLDSLPAVRPDKVLLMPQAKTRQELLAKSPMVAEMCKLTGFAFCHRLQILLWNNKNGT